MLAVLNNSNAIVGELENTNSLTGVVNYGTRGGRGPQGEDGRNVEDVEVNDDNSLTFYMSDLTTITTEPLTVSGATVNYATLQNLPKINNVILTGNKTTADLGIEIPTKTSDLTNDSGFLTSHQSLEGKQDVLVSGENIKTINGNSILGAGNIVIQGGSGGTSDYTQLSNKPSINNVTLSGNLTTGDLGIVIPTKTSDLTNDSGFLTQHQSLNGYATQAWVGQQGYLTQHQDISGKANTADLATVAFTGNYNNLINTPTIPTIPTNVSYFTNDAGYLTSHQSLSGYATQTWVNQQGFLTSHQSLNGYATESWVTNQGYQTASNVATAISNVFSFDSTTGRLDITI